MVVDVLPIPTVTQRISIVAEAERAEEEEGVEAGAAVTAGVAVEVGKEEREAIEVRPAEGTGVVREHEQEELGTT